MKLWLPIYLPHHVLEMLAQIKIHTKFRKIIIAGKINNHKYVILCQSFWFLAHIRFLGRRPPAKHGLINVYGFRLLPTPPRKLGKSQKGFRNHSDLKTTQVKTNNKQLILRRPEFYGTAKRNHNFLSRCIFQSIKVKIGRGVNRAVKDWTDCS